MDEKVENEGPRSIIKVTWKDKTKYRRPGDHMVIMPPRQLLCCLHCGYWLKPFPESNCVTLSIRIYCAISRAFGADHRRCKPSPDGRSTYIILKREWDDFMEKYPKEREEWEKDHETKWERRDWGKEYDEWFNLPFRKRGKHESANA
jgi:hypothetical protein